MKVGYLSGMNLSASALSAQRAAMNAAAENLANAQTTRTETGDPYRRKIVSFSSVAVDVPAGAAPAPGSGLVRTDPDHLEPASPPVGSLRLDSVAAKVEEDSSEFPMIYDPSHPDADGNGMVRMPNVDVAREMVTLMVASRAYEANIAALQASKRMAEASLNMAR